MFSNLLGSNKKSEKSSKKTSSSVKYPNNFADTTLAMTAAKSPSSFVDNTPLKLTNDSASLENVNSIIEASYQQVFGNVRLMESERLPRIESQLRNGQITVKEFVRQLAKSEKYRALFWDGYPNLKAIELNFKHLLGRTPESYQEISQHTKTITESGFAAEIDSYLDSDEYNTNFGDTLVPYYRGYTTQTGNNLAGYIYSVPSSKLASNSDTSISKIASLKLLTTNKIKNIPGVIPSIRPIPTSYPVPVVLPSSGYNSQGIRPSDEIPEEMIEKKSITAGSSTSSYRRKPIVDKTFLNMARNIPYYLR